MIEKIEDEIDIKNFDNALRRCLFCSSHYCSIKSLRNQIILEQKLLNAYN